NTPPQTFHADTPYGSPPPAGWVPGWVQRLGSSIANLGRTARGIVHGNVNPDFRRGLHVSADWVTGLMPGASDVRDIAEVGLGRDIVTGEPLTGPEMAITLAAAAMPFVSAPLARKLLGKWTKFGKYVPRVNDYKHALDPDHVKTALKEKQGMITGMSPRTGKAWDHLTGVILKR